VYFAGPTETAQAAKCWVALFVGQRSRARARFGVASRRLTRRIAMRDYSVEPAQIAQSTTLFGLASSGRQKACAKAHVGEVLPS